MSFKSTIQTLPTATRGKIKRLGRLIRNGNIILKNKLTEEENDLIKVVTESLDKINNPEDELISNLKPHGAYKKNNFQSQSNNLEAQFKGELIEAILKRFKPTQMPLINTVIEDPDFLPFSNLYRGHKLGSAVCRIIKPFDKEKEIGSNQKTDLEELLEWIPGIHEALRIIRGFGLTENDIADLLSVEVGLISASLSTLVKDESAGSVQELSDKKFKELVLSPTFKNLVLSLGKAVCATGFLVGRDYLLTNFHLFADVGNQEYLVDLKDKNYVAEFGYELDYLGRPTVPLGYPLEKIVLYSKNLDYALVKLGRLEGDDNKEGHIELKAGDIFGWIQLSAEKTSIAPVLDQDIKDIFDEIKETPLIKKLYKTMSGKDTIADDEVELTPDHERRGAKGDSVIIIQHPRGRRKEIVLSNNRLKTMSLNYLQYTADVDFSSSGSPVFNQQWKLVGLHQSAIVRNSEENYELSIRQSGSISDPSRNETNLIIVTKLGDSSYHCRIFNSSGHMTIDKGHDEFLPNDELVQELENALNSNDEILIMQEISSILGYTDLTDLINYQEINNDFLFEIELEQGVRICRIVEDIRDRVEKRSQEIINSKSANSKTDLLDLWSFYNRFVEDENPIPWTVLSLKESEIIDSLIKEQQASPNELGSSVDGPSVKDLNVSDESGSQGSSGAGRSIPVGSPFSPYSSKRYINRWLPRR